MSFSTFFSKQARKPSGLFGRIVMSTIFDIGNAYLNKIVNETIAIQNNDHVLDIGCGTGNLVRNLSSQVSDAYIEGVDFSPSMASIARRKNKKLISKGRVNIVEGEFNTLTHQNKSFDKVCCVNTIYFWPSPEITAQKISKILKPGGFVVIAFEDIQQLKQRNLNPDVFCLYTTEKVKDLLSKSGFGTEIDIISKSKGELKFHCVVAKKTT
jgi:ubiquinone/menaquinone biosynthesis C-methylase UbiE